MYIRFLLEGEINVCREDKGAPSSSRQTFISPPTKSECIGAVKPAQQKKTTKGTCLF